MAFDGIVTKSVVAELNHCLIGAKITKIFQPNRSDLLLGFYQGGKNYALHLCVKSGNYHMCLTNHAKPNPLVAPNFCMVLRKHLMSGKLISIETKGLERVVELVFECRNELNDLVLKRLFIELTGKHSNIILTTQNQKIIDTLIHISPKANYYRELLPAREYELPENTKYDFMTISNFEEFIKVLPLFSNQPLDKDLADTFTGFSRLFVRHQLDLLCLSELDQSKDSLFILYQNIQEIVNCIDTPDIRFVTLAGEKNKKDYSIEKGHKKNDLEINFMIDDFYFEKETTDTFITTRNNLLRIILSYLNKYHKRLENMNKKLKECDSMDQYRIYGELITANLYRAPKENVDTFQVENFYDGNRYITIPLDKRFSVSKNATRYFKKYNKLKNALEIVTKQKKETEKELDYIESIVFSIEDAQTLADINEIYQEIVETLLKDSLNQNKKKKGTEKKSEPLEYTIHGFTVLVGKNNKQNDFLTLRVASNNDLWFHTQKIHGAHVILRTEGKEVDEDTLKQCAILAAQHSKAKQSSNVPVDYTYVKYVRKPNAAKPGMVTYVNYKTLYVTP